MPSPPPAPSEAAPHASRLQSWAALSTILLGAGMILAGRVFGAVPLFVVGIGFLVVGVLSPAWVLAAARGATLQRRITVHRAIEDEPLEAVIEIHRGWLGLPGAQLHDPLSAITVSVAEPLSVLTGRAQAQLRVVARIPTRGRHRFAPPTLSLVDSLGLVHVNREGSGAPDEILILPRTEPVHWVHLHHRQSATGRIHHVDHEPLGTGEVDGLRQYVPGTPASRIHWPALARYPNPPTLLERRLVADTQTLPLLVLDSRRRVGGSDPELLNVAVRGAASLILDLARHGGCRVILPGDRVATTVGSDLAAWPGVHTRLALVEDVEEAGQGLSLRSRATRGPVILVSTRLDPQMALSTVPSHAEPLILVIPRRLGSRVEVRSSFEVAGCIGYLLRAGARRLRRGAAA
jgi:uncharacterized protein (DUF58 family)